MDSPEQIFEYRFISKHKGLLWGLVYFVPGLLVTFYSIPIVTDSQVTGLIGSWSILGVLILLAIWKEKTDQAELSEIKISTDGIWAHLSQNRFEYFPKKDVQLIPWSLIDGYRYFSYPDQDAYIMAGKGGVRLMLNDMDKKINIYEHIKDYESLLEIIKSKLPRL